MCSPVCSLYPPVLTPLTDSPPPKETRADCPPPRHPTSHTLGLDSHPLSYQQQSRMREWKGCAEGDTGVPAWTWHLQGGSRGMKRHDQKKKGGGVD